MGWVGLDWVGGGVGMRWGGVGWGGVWGELGRWVCGVVVQIGKVISNDQCRCGFVLYWCFCI